MNELSDNFSFDSKFSLDFETLPFKFVFLACVLFDIFQNIRALNGSNKSIVLACEIENCNFPKLRVVGGGTLCRLTTWVERARNQTNLSKFQ